MKSTYFHFRSANTTPRWWSGRTRRAIGLLFGGGLSLTPIDAAVPDLISRVGITQGEVADTAGNLHAAALAAYLFRRPHRALQPS